jgi:hypothetical protein
MNSIKCFFLAAGLNQTLYMETKYILLLDVNGVMIYLLG